MICWLKIIRLKIKIIDFFVQKESAPLLHSKRAENSRLHASHFNTSAYVKM